MTQDMARLALQFLERVQLRGSEVDAYAAVRAALAEAAAPKPAPEPEKAGGTD